MVDCPLGAQLARAERDHARALQQRAYSSAPYSSAHHGAPRTTTRTMTRVGAAHRSSAEMP